VREGEVARVREDVDRRGKERRAVWVRKGSVRSTMECILSNGNGNDGDGKKEKEERATSSGLLSLSRQRRRV
jgi:hypothetical protein